MTDLFMGDDTAKGAFKLLANFSFYNFFNLRAEPGLPVMDSGGCSDQRR